MKQKTKTETVGAFELAKLLGLSSQAVADHAKNGVVVRVGRGQYDKDASVTAYCAHLRKSASGRNSPTSEEKARLVRLQADAIARKNAVADGELVPVVDVKNECSAIARKVRSLMLAIPSRLSAHLPQLGPSDLAVIDREIRDVLTALADDKDDK